MLYFGRLVDENNQIKHEYHKVIAWNVFVLMNVGNVLIEKKKG